MKEKLKDSYILVGFSISLRCKIEGNPTPKTVWYFNDRLIIGDDDRLKFAQTEDGVITLSITKARVSDIGVYRCVARNRYGMAITKASVTIGDVPNRPTRPIVSQFCSNQVYLVWESPSFDGNSDILCYKVDYKIFNDVKWINALFTIEECCLVKNLEPNTRYRFRVSCINTIGISAYSWASEEIQTLETGAPGIKIDHDLAEKLLKNQYKLDKRAHQLKLVQSLDDNLKESSIVGKEDLSTFNLRTNENPADFFEPESKLFEYKEFTLSIEVEKHSQAKRIVKYSTKYHPNELNLLRKLNSHDRVLRIIDGFEYRNMNTNELTYSMVYSYSVPIVDYLSMRNKYSEEIVVRILRQLLDAIQWLHLHGYMHLNINPLSIFNANLTQVNIKLSGFEHSIDSLEAKQQQQSIKALSNELAIEFTGKNFQKKFFTYFL